MIVIVAEGGFGECEPEGVENNEGLYECKECSGDIRIFHNVQGEQRHVSQEELRQMLNLV